MAAIERGAFRPVASPRDTVAVQTRMFEGVAPLAPVRPLAPEAPQMPRPPRQGPSSLAQLGAALEGLNPRITGAIDKFYKGQQEADSLEAELRAMRDNVTSWSEAVKADPTLADKSPYFRQVYEGRAARTLVQRRSGELLAEYYSSPIAGSDDPGLINQWLAQRLKDTIESAESPAQRMAMIEEVQKLSGQFISAHRENAVRNLVQNNATNIGIGLGTAIDNYAAQGGTYNEGAPSGSYYAALSGKESGGRNIGNIGGHSSAFGIYQFTTGTWADLMKKHPGLGLTAAGRGDVRQQEIAIKQFTADNAAALARAGIPVNDKNLYMTHFLGEAGGPRFLQRLAQSPDTNAIFSVTPDQVAANKTVFYDKSGRPRTNRELYAMMTKRFSSGSTHAEAASGGVASGGLSSLTTTVHEMETEARLQGMSPDAINTLSVQAVTNKMLEHDDETLANVLLQPRPDGTPGAGMTVQGRAAIEQARSQVLNARTQRQNAAAAQEERERKAAIREYKGIAMEGLMEQIMAGQAPKLDPQLIRDATRIDADLAGELLEAQRNLDSYDKTEDRNEVNHVAHGVMSGLLGVDDVFLAVRDGKLKDASTIRNLYDEAKRNDNGGVMQNAVLKDALNKVEALVGENIAGVITRPEQASQAQFRLRRSFSDFMEDNPRASERQQSDFIEAEISAVLKDYKPDNEYDDWRDGDPDRPGAVTAPEPAKPSTTSQPAVQSVTPTTDYDWQSRPVYGDRATLDREYQEFLNGGSPNNFSLWVSRLGFTSKDQIRQFVETQRKLGGQQR